jgi:2-amino-4-hydroxy-6-hydroxymethyldihydropteridine diphosphokinase
MVQVAIALGSNLGDRQAALEFAVRRLSSRLQNLSVSSMRETDPIGVGPQPGFLNGALVGNWEGTARELLDLLRAIEDEAGRTRPYSGAARTLDLDLILAGPLVIDEPDLRVPHPRFRERRFVLEPLAEVGPEMVDPVTGSTVNELWQAWQAANTT